MILLQLGYIVYMEATADGFSKSETRRSKRTLTFLPPGSIASQDTASNIVCTEGTMSARGATRQLSTRILGGAGEGMHGSHWKRNNFFIVVQAWDATVGATCLSNKFSLSPLLHHLNDTFCLYPSAVLAPAPCLVEPPPRASLLSSSSVSYHHVGRDSVFQCFLLCHLFF